MSRNTRLARKMRSYRQSREFERALRHASPAMQQELMAAATRQNSYMR